MPGNRKSHAGKMQYPSRFVGTPPKIGERGETGRGVLWLTVSGSRIRTPWVLYFIEQFPLAFGAGDAEVYLPDDGRAVVVGKVVVRYLVLQFFFLYVSVWHGGGNYSSTSSCKYLSIAFFNGGKS